MENPTFSDNEQETIQPPSDATLSTTQVVKLVGIRRGDIGRWLLANGIYKVGVEPERRENIYPADQVRAAARNRKGKGNRIRGPERVQAALKSWETRRRNMAEEK